MNASEYLDSVGVKYWTKGKNVSKHSVNISCVFCNDRSNHLGINLENGSVHCWRCGRKNLTKLIQILSDCSFREAKVIEEQLEFSVKKEERKKGSDIDILRDFIKPLTEPYVKYLAKRDFDARMIESKYSLMQAEVYSKYKYRLIIPVIMKGSAVGFTARDITGRASLRYLTCNENEVVRPKSEWLYNVDTVKDTAIIVEGAPDVWRLGDGAIALMGTGFSTSQVAAIAEMKLKRIFIMFDVEETAQERSLALARSLSAFAKNVEIVKIDSGDPAEMGDDDALALRRELKI